MILYLSHGRTGPDAEMTQEAWNRFHELAVAGVHMTYGQTEVYFADRGERDRVCADIGWPTEHALDERSCRLPIEGDCVPATIAGRRLFFSDWGLR